MESKESRVRLFLPYSLIVTPYPLPKSAPLTIFPYVCPVSHTLSSTLSVTTQWIDLSTNAFF